MYVSSSYRVFIFAVLTTITVASVGCRSHKATSSGETTTASNAPLTSPGEIKLTSFESTTASGQPSSYDGTDVAALDVAGVRLGMTPEQAVAALKSFDSGLYFSKRYLTGSDGFGFEQSLPESQAKSEPYRQFVSIIAAKGTNFYDSTTAAAYPEDTAKLPGDEQERISVYFSADPGNHRVIAISLREKFKTPRTVSSIIGSIEQKYPKDVTSSTNNNGGPIHFWRYDQRMRLMSNAAAQQEWHGSYSRPFDFDSSNLPSVANEGDAVALDAGVDFNGDNKQFTDAAGIVLYDESALYRYLEQSPALYNNFKAGQVQQQANQSKDSAPVKF